MNREVNDIIIDKILDCDLTDNQQDFVLYYLQSNNATQAYLKAYNGSKKWAHIKGSQLLKTPKVKEAITKMKKILLKSYDLDPSQYIDYLVKVAHADLGDFLHFSEEEVPVLDTDGTPMFNTDTGEPLTKKVNKMHLVNSDYVDTSSLIGVKQGRDGISIQLADKAKAWDKLAEYFGWTGKKSSAEVDDSGILTAIQGKVDSSWDDDIDADLDATLKADN